MNRKRRIIAIVLLILTLCFIWFQSVLSREASKSESARVLRFISRITERLFDFTPTEKLIRKCAHAIEYCLLGMEAAVVFADLDRARSSMFRSISLCGFAALLDETIQIFSGRGSLVSDVWIDIGGATFGVCTVVILMLLLKKEKT